MVGCLEGIDGIRVDGYAVFYKGEKVKLPYPEDPQTGDKMAKGKSFHHGRFIRRLREASQSRPD